MAGGLQDAAVTTGGKKPTALRQVMLGTLLVGLAAALALGLRTAGTETWPGTARWQVLHEAFAAFIALQVALFALSRFGLERRRLLACIGMAFLGAAMVDAVAALVTQGSYLVALVGQTQAVRGVWCAGRLITAGFLVLGLVVQDRAAEAGRVRGELVAVSVIGLAGGAVLVQLAQMTVTPLILCRWLVIGLCVAALPGYWRLYRRRGGSIEVGVMFYLLLAAFGQATMNRSEVAYDTMFTLGSGLRIAGYFPLLVGLFVESVVLFRTQKKLTGRLRVARAELSEYSKGLEVKVAERTEALAARAAELEAFAYTVSHDLKAPLRGVQTYSRMLLDDHREQLDEEGQRYLHNLNRSSVNMKQLIDDLLEYSRLERRQVEPITVNVAELVAGLLQDRQAIIDETGADCTVEVDRLPPLRADRTMLRMALANLIDNALKFSRDAAPPRITVRGHANGDAVEISVSDNGIGFDPEHATKIFEVFQRLHRADEIEGTGIGLSTVKRAVEKQGGTVRAESALGEGARFTIRIPAGGQD